MPTTREQLDRWLQEPEGTNLEFKSAENSYSFDHLIDYCVALANERGGKIILGVSDKRPRRIVGTRAFADPGRTEGGLHDRLHHRISIEELRLTEGRVLIVHVPSRLPGSAWITPDGKVLKRAGDQLIGMNFNEIAAIQAEIGPDFSAQPCEGVDWSDLSSAAVAEFRKRWVAKSQDERKLKWTDEETLTNAELFIDGCFTYSALILFATHRAMGRWLNHAELVFEYRPTEASGPAADRAEFREGVFLWYDKLWETINLRNTRQSYQAGLFRYSVPTFDEIPVREALLNAIAHRDYRLGGSIFVRQYPQRLEVVSPGGLPPGITPDNILDQQNPRNRRLAEAFAKCGLIERSGQGVNLMFENAIRQGKPLPDFEGTSDYQVCLRLDGTISNPQFISYLENLGEKTRYFSTNDFLVLDALQKDQPLSDHLKKHLPGLLEVGAIEAIGKGRGTQYILSRSLYTAMGKRGTYTRRKGLDHETNKALLLTHLKNDLDSGARMQEFRQVLPHLNRQTILRLLQELRAEKLIRKEGVTANARWFINEDF